MQNTFLYRVCRALPLGALAMTGFACRSAATYQTSDYQASGSQSAEQLLIGAKTSRTSSVQISRPASRAATTATQRPQNRQAPAIPRWAQGQVVRHVRVKPGQKVFALSFDDGPWPHETRRILKILRDRKVKATFFMLGQEVKNYPDIVRDIYRDGHAVGNHSWNHPSRPRDPRAQVTRTNEEIKKTLGFEPNLFRPPYGMLKNGLAREAMKQKMAVVLWSSDSNDWKHPGAASIVRTVLRQASPGGIALMHDGGGNRAQTIAALPIIIERLQARGYQFVTVPQLLAMRHVAPQKAKSRKTTQKTVPVSTRKPTPTSKPTPTPIGY